MKEKLVPTTNALEAIAIFIKMVEERAEEYMLKTHKLEGMHYAAMKEIAKELGL